MLYIKTLPNDDQLSMKDVILPDEELSDAVFVFVDGSMQQSLRTSVGSFAPPVNIGAVPNPNKNVQTYLIHFKTKIRKYPNWSKLLSKKNNISID